VIVVKGYKESKDEDSLTQAQKSFEGFKKERQESSLPLLPSIV